MNHDSFDELSIQRLTGPTIILVIKTQCINLMKRITISVNLMCRFYLLRYRIFVGERPTVLVEEPVLRKRI